MKEGEMSHWSKQELYDDFALRQELSVSPTKRHRKESSFGGLQQQNNVEVRSFSMKLIV